MTEAATRTKPTAPAVIGTVTPQVVIAELPLLASFTAADRLAGVAW
jgi:hypothetical protein